MKPVRNKIVQKIKNKDGRVATLLYFFIKKIVRFNVPPLKIIYIPLLHARFATLKIFNFLVQKFFNEPMFKVHCAQVGKGFRIHAGFPFVSSNIQFVIGDNVSIDGKNSFVGGSVFSDPTFRIGDGTYIGYGTSVTVGKSVAIGKNCLIAGNVFICDSNGHPLAPNRRHQKLNQQEISEVIIGDNVWLCSGAFVGRGVTIGDGAVVAANTVVTKDVDAHTIVAGNPAQVVKVFGPEEIQPLPTEQ